MPAASTIAVVFPGQGSQKAGMGRDFYDQSAAARRAFEEASDALGFAVDKLCFEDDPRLARTEFQQPAILTVEVAMLRALGEQFAFAPQYFGGHSLGEYAALVAAGVLSLGDAARIVRERGRLMQACVPEGEGAMVAVLSPGSPLGGVETEIENLQVDVANDNAPDQVVLSGRADDVATAVERLKARGGRLRAIPLRVSAPFHSRLMRPVEEPLGLALASATWNPAPAPRVTSNVRGGFHSADVTAITEALVSQVSAPVRWTDNMRALVEHTGTIIELGPGRPLRAFFKALGTEIQSISTVEQAEAVLRPSVSG